MDRIVLVDAIEQLCVKFPNKYQTSFVDVRGLTFCPVAASLIEKLWMIIVHSNSFSVCHTIIDPFACQLVLIKHLLEWSVRQKIWTVWHETLLNFLSSVLREEGGFESCSDSSWAKFQFVSVFVFLRTWQSFESLWLYVLISSIFIFFNEHDTGRKSWNLCSPLRQIL